MQKYNWNRKKNCEKENWKKKDLLSRLVTPTGTKGPLLSRLPDPGEKGTPFSRTGVPGWETGTTAVSQPEQINVFVVVVETQPWRHVNGWKVREDDGVELN